MKTNFLPCCLLWGSLLLSSNLWAQASSLPPISMTPEIKELGLYYGKIIMPAIQQQRLKLDASLSAPDKKLLDEYRAKTDKVYADFRATRRLLPVTDKASNLARVQQERQQISAIYNPSDSLAQKYEVLIRKLLQELEPLREKWEAELAAIQNKHQLGNASNLLPAHNPTSLLSGLLRPAMFISMHPPQPRKAVTQAQVQ